MSLAFLSYTMRDGLLDAGLLEAIADGLRGSHELVYVDLLHNDRHQRQQHLEEVLRCSTTLYLVDTPGVLMSRWVRRELSLAMRLGIVVTPVRHGGLPIGAISGDARQRGAVASDGTTPQFEFLREARDRQAALRRKSLSL